ncbi:MAG TPA: hypothetical protein VFU64_09680 [Gaiellaceae bacterium]|nr:hypothetical protein [Gaiellaceae bacterium]
MPDDHSLLEAFLAGRVDASAFPHECHVRVAWGLSRRYPHEEAFARLAEGIRGIAARAGVPGKYHATITRAWFELVAQAETLWAHPELFDRGLLGLYYSASRLAAGRHEWLEPDLEPLVLAPVRDRSPA